MDNFDAIPPVEDSRKINDYLESSLASRKLTLDEKTQILRDLMGSDLGMNPTFHMCCENMLRRLRQESLDSPTITIASAHVFLNNPNVLLSLETSPLRAIVDGDIAFRVLCIAELGRMGRTDILLKQIGYLSHWKEGHAMVQTLLRFATTEQLFYVLMVGIYNQFSNKGPYHFGPDVYREEVIDMLFSAVVSRASLSMLHDISSELAKGNAAVGLHNEQFQRYSSLVATRLISSQMKQELPGLIDITSSPVQHPESSAFWIGEGTVSGSDRPVETFLPPPLSSPTRIDRLAIPRFGPAVFPPRPDREDDSAPFGIGGEDSQV